MNKSITHPILFSIFPIISFYSTNKQSYPVFLIFLPLIVSILFAIFSYFSLYTILRDKSKSSLIVSLFLVLFFSYGHFYALVNHRITEIATSILGYSIVSAEKITIISFAVILLLGASLCLLKVPKIPQNFITFLNITAAFLLFIPIFNVAVYEIEERAGQYRTQKEPEVKAKPADSGKAAKTPDIYYIILDGYGRADILDEVYDYKNDDFLAYLTQKGFYIAEKSRSNYGQTALSLTSSLNMQYLDDLTPHAGTDSRDMKVLKEYLTDNKVARFLRQHGYLFVAFSSGYFATDMLEADIYVGNFWYLNEFHRGLIDSTALPLLLRSFQSPLQRYQRNILKTFETLSKFPKLPEYKSPIFAFVHITTPHPPFVFNPHGEKLGGSQMRLPVESVSDANHLIKNQSDQKAYLQGYRDQLIYINKIVMKTIDSILKESKSPPIIILQSDHGPGAFFDLDHIANSYMRERFSILNCYYMPHDIYNQLYKEVTPVNSFRIIFNHYFGTNYKKFEDKSYYSTSNHPFLFTDVTEIIDNKDLASFIDSRRPSSPIGSDE